MIFSRMKIIVNQLIFGNQGIQVFTMDAVREALILLREALIILVSLLVLYMVSLEYYFYYFFLLLSCVNMLV